MKKTFILLLIALLTAPFWASAANDVTVSQRINILLPSDELTYYLDSGSSLDSFTVNTSSISFTVSADSTLSLTSSDKKNFTVALPGGSENYVNYSVSCVSSTSVLTMTVASGAPAAYIVEVTPSGTLANCPATIGGGYSGGGGGVSVPSTPSPVSNQETEQVPTIPAEIISNQISETLIIEPSNVSSLISAFSLQRDQARENQAKENVFSDLSEFKIIADNDQQVAMANFVVYGISEATIKLGQGERRAVLRDYLNTVQRAQVNWADIERITNGEKPVNRNLASEQAQLSIVLAAFEKIVGHRPDFKNAKEDLAWNTMMYRIRFTRDLNKERAGIGDFQGLYNRLPKSPFDWSMVRALGYALR